MKRLLLLVPAVILTGCLASGITEDDLDSRFDPAQRLSPTAFEQNATMKDTSVHEDPSLMRVGVTRDQIAAAFGKPNETSDQTGQVQDVYEFNPDGSKFVKPKVYARNIAAGVFTGGIATVVHQARIHATEQQLTVYRLTYGPDGVVQSVQKESRQDDSNAGGSQPPPNP
jgi:outer membrane protein assembly factor BamE (lipoprotein component of BamABCDE complex)